MNMQTPTPPTVKTEPDRELAFMRRFAAQLERMEKPMQRRVVRYLLDRYGNAENTETK